MTVLRMFVLSLVLINIVLFAARALQPGGSSADEPVQNEVRNTPRPSIELLENLPVNNAVVEPEISVEPQEQPSAQAAMESPGCIQLGPFNSEDGLAVFQTEVVNLFERVQTLETESTVEKGYWVYLPPYPTRAEALQVVEQMSEAGAKDFYVVPRGITVNAVSLGVFRNMSRAERRQKQIRKLDLGLDIAIELQTDIESRYWLQGGPIDALDPALIQLSSSYPQIEQLQIPCAAEVLQPEQFMTGIAPGSSPF
ncbi:SPOR domain-containing protein [Pseudomonadota bacterium]